MKARVIVTLDCNKNCVGCVNKDEDFKSPKVLTRVDDLLKYDEIIITGGEPLLIPEKVYEFITLLNIKKKYRGRIYLYTSYFPKEKAIACQSIMTQIDGLTFTLHAVSTDKDITELKQLSESNFLKQFKDKSFRLFIDDRLYAKYDFSNINLSNWSVIRRLQWQEHCVLPSNEELFIYKL